MKKLLSILSICLVFISCTSTPEEVTEEAPIRVLNEELTNKGTDKIPIMYFEGKPFTGVEFDVFNWGQLYYEENYKDGKLDGFSKMWGGDGQLETDFNYKDGNLDGIQQEWYENGQLRYKGKYKDDKEDGLSLKWYDNGQLEYKINYKDGKRDGLTQKWFKNGQLEEEDNYKDGIRL